MKVFLASALLLLSAWGFAQNDVRPPDSAKKNSCPSCLAKSFVGRLAPDFELPTLDGNKLKLSDLRGKAVLLNFWCTCGISKVEIPTLVELQNEYGPQGFQVIGVALDVYPDTEDVSDFAREMNVNYPIMIGKRSSFEKRYGGVIFLSMAYFVDRDGKVIAREVGVQTAASM
jgi:peroxiredoxin